MNSTEYMICFSICNTIDYFFVFHLCIVVKILLLDCWGRTLLGKCLNQCCLWEILLIAEFAFVSQDEKSSRRKELSRCMIVDRRKSDFWLLLIALLSFILKCLQSCNSASAVLSSLYIIKHACLSASIDSWQMAMP